MLHFPTPSPTRSKRSREVDDMSLAPGAQVVVIGDGGVAERAAEAALVAGAIVQLIRLPGDLGGS